MPSTSFGPEMPLTVSNIYRLPASAVGANYTLVSSGPQSLMTIDGYNTGPGGIRLAIYDKSTAPVDGDSPKVVIFMPGQTKTSDSWPGLKFTNGLGFSLMPESDGVVVAEGDVYELSIGYSPR